MSDYTLLSSAYATVTPSGAYYAATSDQDDPAQNLITALLRMPQSPQLDPQTLQSLFPQENESSGLELLFRMQQVGWITGESSPSVAPDFNMERDIPPLLGNLSGEGRALLADAEGFYLANAGFAHEVLEELSILAADIASINHRHRLLVRNNLRIHSSGWATVDGAGNSQLGFWPIQISQQVFVLLIAGEPKFNQPCFKDLIWWLARRYSSDS